MPHDGGCSAQTWRRSACPAPSRQRSARSSLESPGPWARARQRPCKSGWLGILDALAAGAVTSSTLISFSAFTPVSNSADCGQIAAILGAAAGLTDSKVASSISPAGSLTVHALSPGCQHVQKRQVQQRTALPPRPALRFGWPRRAWPAHLASAWSGGRRRRLAARRRRALGCLARHGIGHRVSPQSGECRAFGQKKQGFTGPSTHAK